MRCQTCQAEVSDAARSCPVCQCPLTGGALARPPEADALTRKIDDEVARDAVGGMLARAAPLSDLIREESLVGALDPAELRGMLTRSDAPGVAPDEGLSRLLPEELASLDLDGLSLSRLIDVTSGDVRTLKPGLVLIRHRRYPEASEYWNLQRLRVADDPTKERLAFLLLVLDAFTWKLAGDAGRLREALERVRAHPHMQRLRGGP